MPGPQIGCGRRKRRSTAAGGGPLPEEARVVFVENSYGAQTGMQSPAEWAILASGCHGVRPIAWRYARGGDTMQHAIGRWSQIDAMVPAVIKLMNAQNDFAEGITLAQMQARLLAILQLCRANSSFKRLIVPTQPETTSLSTAQVAPWNTWLKTVFALEPDVTVADVAAVFNPRNDATVRNDAGSHPNQKGARLIGEIEGAALASLFRSEPIIAPGAAFPGNLNANWNMPGTSGSAKSPASGTVATGFTLSNGSGANVSATKGALRANGAPCQIISVSGTASADPANAAATGDIRLRTSVTLPAGTSTLGRIYRAIVFLEVTSASGSAPVNLATVSLQCAQSSLFNKVYTAAAGPVAQVISGVVTTTPAPVTTQAGTIIIDIVLRPLAGAACDIEVRLGLLNLVETEIIAYAAPCDQSVALPAGRPAIFQATQLSGAAAIGSNLSITRPAIISGGGIGYDHAIFRQPYLDPVDIAGDIEPATASAGTVAYTVQPADGGLKLRMREVATNAHGSVAVWSTETNTVS